VTSCCRTSLKGCRRLTRSLTRGGIAGPASSNPHDRVRGETSAATRPRKNVAATAREMPRRQPWAWPVGLDLGPKWAQIESRTTTSPQAPPPRGCHCHRIIAQPRPLHQSVACALTTAASPPRCRALIRRLAGRAPPPLPASTAAAAKDAPAERSSKVRPSPPEPLERELPRGFVS
jgi:hypothetical protein